MFLSEKQQRTTAKLWIENRTYPLTPLNLELLYQNRIPCIQIPSFLDMRSFGLILNRLEKVPFRTYSHVYHAVGHLGIAVDEFYEQENKDGYFRAVHLANRETNRLLLGCELDPNERMMLLLEKTSRLHTELAKEPRYGAYFSGGFRNIHTMGKLHFDFSPLEHPGWEVARVSEQLTWNLYYNTPEGGELIIYNHPAQTSDRLHRIAGSYHYDQELVRYDQRLIYQPKQNELILFNSKNFHEIRPVLKGNRFTQSSFIGRINGARQVFWS